MYNCTPTLLPSTNVVMNYSDVETKVREATNDESWGPSGSLMGDIAKYTYTYEHHPEVMSMLWKRMFESKRNWRRTYKVCVIIVMWYDWFQYCIILVCLLCHHVFGFVSQSVDFLSQFLSRMLIMINHNYSTLLFES